MNIGIVNGQWQVTNGLLYYVCDEVVHLVIISDRLETCLVFLQRFEAWGYRAQVG